MIVKLSMDQITIKDIARALNLSNSTVSRALKGSYQISEATQKLVKDYAVKHHYRPNVLAQSLKSRRSKSIGVIFPSVSNNFFGEVTNGIEAVASTSHYQVVIVQTNESAEKELDNIKQLILRSVDGLLISCTTQTTDTAFFQELLNDGFPIIFIDRTIGNLAAHCVVADNVDGAYQATLHLIEQGYQRIAQITSSPNVSITIQRLQGYFKALNQNNLTVEDDYIKYCQHGGMDDAEVERAVTELMQMPNPPDAILTASDRITIKCFSVLLKKGIDIPGQVALAGFSNFSAPELFNPSLTTVKQPAFEMGKAAVELMLGLLESKHPPTEFVKKVLPTELLIKSSSLKK